MHTTPVQVVGLDAVKQISASDASCALREDGTVWCWGDNTYGGLGISLPDGETYSATPVQVGLNDIVAVDGSGCALSAEGTVACWGDNSSAQMGLNDANSRIMVVPTPTQLPNVADAIQVTAGGSNICVLQRSGEVLCAGDNAACEVDFTCSNTFEVPSFMTIPGLNDVKNVAVGSQFGCAVKNDDKLYCWGMNLWGELGRGNNKSAPAYPATIEPVKWP
jgi:alpha-tubulin suppressor-like RCC1 family protein